MHFLRDMLGHVARAQQPGVATAIRQVFAAENRATPETVPVQLAA